ncbi:non-canonical purine NTP pyrophosphatase [Alphaproteobacteria bacterium]|nr:non-canonical purine NTP pyrophosphatase [Alphaproteobacteria bacterium]
MGKIFFITGNEDKKREMSGILADVGIELDFVKVDLPELQGTPEYVCREKAKLAFERIREPCFVDDTCLEFNAHKGLPGVYIKWFLDNMGLVGLNRMLADFEDKGATAVCTIGLALSAGDVHTFRGATTGFIVPPRGSTDFGWDAVFEEEVSGKTYGEMGSEDRNECSHRGKAYEMLRNFLLGGKNG